MFLKSHSQRALNWALLAHINCHMPMCALSVSTTLYFDDYKTCVCFTNFSTKYFSLRIYTEAVLKENRSTEVLTEALKYLQKHRDSYRSTGVKATSEVPELWNRSSERTTEAPKTFRSSEDLQKCRRPSEVPKTFRRSEDLQKFRRPSEVPKTYQKFRSSEVYQKIRSIQQKLWRLSEVPKV